MPKAINGTEINWKWRAKRWWMGLLIFYVVSVFGCGIMVQTGFAPPGKEGGFIIFLMMLFAILAACTDRGWSIPIRIVWVIGVWIIHALLTPIAFPLCFLLPRPELCNRTIYLFAAFPLVIWAMRRSRFFVEPVAPKDQDLQNPDSTPENLT